MTTQKDKELKENECQPTQSNTDVNSVADITNEYISDKLKNKAHARLTAYQASAIMTGVSDLLDKIDGIIFNIAKSNKSEVQYKLEGQELCYCNALTQSLKQRGFTVNVRQGSDCSFISISWPMPSVY